MAPRSPASVIGGTHPQALPKRERFDERNMKNFNVRPDGLRVRLAHSCPVIRAGLVSILSEHTSYSIISDSEYQNPYDDCLIIADYDSAMRLAGALRIQPTSPGPKIIIFTSRNTEWEVQRAFSAGAQGYLLHGCKVEELVNCLDSLANGALHISCAATSILNTALRREIITPRQIDVLHALARGLPDKSIAKELLIGSGTVKGHIRDLMLKFNAVSRTHILVIAYQRGLFAVAPGDEEAMKKNSSLKMKRMQRLSSVLPDVVPKRQSMTI